MRLSMLSKMHLSGQYIVLSSLYVGMQTKQYWGFFHILKFCL